MLLYILILLLPRINVTLIFLKICDHGLFEFQRLRHARESMQRKSFEILRTTPPLRKQWTIWRKLTFSVLSIQTPEHHVVIYRVFDDYSNLISLFEIFYVLV